MRSHLVLPTWYHNPVRRSGAYLTNLAGVHRFRKGRPQLIHLSGQTRDLQPAVTEVGLESILKICLVLVDVHGRLLLRLIYQVVRVI